MHNRLFDHVADRHPSVRNSLRNFQTSCGLVRRPVAKSETRPANLNASGVWCLTLRLLLRSGRLSRGRRSHWQLLGLRRRSHDHLTQR